MDSLGDRMKRYEATPRLTLMRRTPVILRFDGKAFHTFTRGLNKPWDQRMEMAMASATMMLCEQIQGARFGYFQSDEISILCTDYEKLETEAWFDYDLQKMVSIGAAIASVTFNKAFKTFCVESGDEGNVAMSKMAYFDGRAFNLPREEVTNYFVWRQNDATRNSIQGLGQKYFSHRELHGKSCDEVQEMLFHRAGLNWNDTPTSRKRGTGIVRGECPMDRGWEVDFEIPIFKQDRQYLERFVFPVDRAEVSG